VLLLLLRNSQLNQHFVLAHDNIKTHSPLHGLLIFVYVQLAISQFSSFQGP
jgi:hypothetical protein